MATRKTASKKTAPAKKPAAKRAPAKKAAAKKPRQGSSTAEERRVHTPEVARSTRAPATKPQPGSSVAEHSPDKRAVDGSIPSPATTRPLTPKEELFVAEYLIDLNATQAYMRSHPGVTLNTARVEGSKLLTNPDVQAAIARERAKTLTNLAIRRDRILLEVARLALFDPRRMFHEDGRPKNVTELDDDTAACIAGLEVLEEWEGSGDDRKLIGYVKKYKVAEKNSALDKLMKHLGLYEKDNAQRGKTLADALGDFLGQLHGTGAARLPIAAPNRALKPGPG